jgi:hypothetical protein
MLSDKHTADFDWHIEALQAVGPRILSELLREMGADMTPHMTAVEAVVAPYAALDPVLVRAIDADQFPPRPLCPVPEGRP